MQVYASLGKFTQDYASLCQFTQIYISLQKFVQACLVLSCFIKKIVPETVIAVVFVKFFYQGSFFTKDESENASPSWLVFTFHQFDIYIILLGGLVGPEYLMRRLMSRKLVQPIQK